MNDEHTTSPQEPQANSVNGAGTPEQLPTTETADAEDISDIGDVALDQVVGDAPTPVETETSAESMSEVGKKGQDYLSSLTAKMNKYGGLSMASLGAVSVGLGINTAIGAGLGVVSAGFVGVGIQFFRMGTKSKETKS